jgi:hypothetical protein
MIGIGTSEGTNTLKSMAEEVSLKSIQFPVLIALNTR